MKRKKAISVIAIILALLMLLSLITSVIPVIAHADELSELDALRTKKEELSGQVKEIKARIESLQEQKANVLDQVVALEEQNRLALEQIKLIDEEISKYEILILNKGREVAAAKDREQVQLDKYRTRVRAMEESGGYNILALILNSDSFSQLMTAMDDMGEIMESDKQLQRDYENAREETEEIKAQYEEEKTVYEGKQEELRGEQAALQSDIKMAAAMLYELQDEIDQAIREYEAAEAAEQAAAETISYLIASYNARKAAEQASQQAASQQAQTQVADMIQANMDALSNGGGLVYTQEQIEQVAQQASVNVISGTQSSGFVWPLPCSSRVTSRFGNRSDPFTGETRYHSGIDIDGFGNDGAPVVAAAAGTVITASYDGSYGNYVVIDHGGTSTVYAHMSGLAVSYGESVGQGQTIGYVGATGRATGTHLHFEVYVGDSRVDPAQYFSNISYYNC